MFCLDYLFSFISHASLVYIGVGHENLSKPKYSYSLGAVAGFMSAFGLYPFDLVRQTVLKGTGHTHFAFSSIPFSTLYLGFYLIVYQLYSLY